MNHYYFSLYPHNPLFNALSLTVNLKLNHKTLTCDFLLIGNINEVIFPVEDKRLRADNLWENTCFECFVAKQKSAEYWEINVAPSLAWNIYHFDRYREGMKLAQDGICSRIKGHIKDAYQLTFEVNFNWCVEAITLVNLSAVINYQGQNTLWSIKPPKGLSDFHDQQLFEVLG